MPIQPFSKTSAPVFYPSIDTKIVKYLDIVKLLSMLQKSSLFFCRLDKLEDNFEGRTSKANYIIRIENLKKLRDDNFFNVEMTDEIIKKTVEDDYINEEKLKSLFLINCWNIDNYESAALKLE